MRIGRAIVAGALAVLGASVVRGADAGRKPNVLLIVSDDLCTEVGCYGSVAKTPNVDALARAGMRFERAYCQYPLCGPSRASFLSGLRPDTTRVYTLGPTVRAHVKDLVTLPELFRHNGYRSMRVGKIYHLGIPGDVGKPGPDDPQSWDSTFNPPGREFPTDADGEAYDPNPKNGQSFRRNLLSDPEGRSQHDYQAATEAVRLLGANKDRPFFLAVGFIRPHVPEIAPKKYFDLYDVTDLKLPVVAADDRADKPAAAFARPDQLDFGMTPAECLESLRAYYATTSFMDAQVGRVIGELDRLGLRDNTIIVFMSDHGYSLGQHRAWQKMMLFEPVCRVPLIVSYPGQATRGRSSAALAEYVDVYPTVAELAGLAAPAALEGTSLVPVLKDPAAKVKDYAFTQVYRRQVNATGRSVRTERYRYTEWESGTAGTELYDEQADPSEHRNLAKDPGHAKVVAELSAVLRARFPTTYPAAKNDAPAGGRGQ